MYIASCLTLIGAVARAAEPPRVAFVYSAWSESAFLTEYDDELQALGWQCEKFENTQTAQLVPRLGEFDLVLASSVANYENPQDMTPYRGQWLSFLQGGGCLLITDASYGTALNLWVNTFGPEYALTTTTCAAHREQTPESREITAVAHPLLSCPNDLLPLLQAHNGIWAHLDSWPEGWDSLITCRDGKSLLLLKYVERGLLVVTSYFSFRTPRDQVAGAALLENLWLYAVNARSGLRVEHLAFGPEAPGPTAAELQLRNGTDRDLALRARVDVEAEDALPVSGSAAELSLAAQQSTRLSLPYTVSTRGKVSLRVIVEDASAARLVDWPRTLHIPPAVTLSLKRKHLYPRQERLEGSARLAPPTGTPPDKVRITWTIDDRLQSATPAAGEVVPLTLPVAALGVGRHTVTATLQVGEETIGEASAEFFRHPTPRWEVREDGVTLLEGEPFFPFGFYHVSQSFDAAHRSKMAQDLSAAGFNCCHARAMTVEEYAPFLDECAKLGVYVVTEFSAPMYETVERYRAHPAVLAWNPGDEPELNGLPADEFYARYDRFKQIAPDHLVYAVIASPSEYHAYAGGTDVLAPDVYPVPFAPITTVYRQLRQASAEAAKHDTMLWGVLQCFGGYGGWTRPPTPQELRAMTYLALLAGVKGILYYTYGDGGWVVTDHPEQWEAAKALVPEIKRLAPTLLNGKFTLLSEGENDLYAGAWEYQGRATTVVVNAGAETRTFEGLGTIEAGETLVREG